MSTIVVGIFVVAKFTEGAWLVVVVFPILVYGLIRLNRQYRAEASVLEMSRTERPDLAKYARLRVFVFVDSVDLAEVEALRYGKGLHADELLAVHFVVDGDHSAQLQERWQHFEHDTQLRVIDCPDRNLGRVAQELVLRVKAEHPDTKVTVLLPRRTYSAMLGRLLHDRTADKMARAVSRIPGATAIIVPYDVESRIARVDLRRVGPSRSRLIPAEVCTGIKPANADPPIIERRLLRAPRLPWTLNLGWGGRDSRSRRARHPGVLFGRVEARLSRETDDHRGVGRREFIEPRCAGRAFARCDLLDGLWARADPDGIAPACRAGSIRLIAAHHGRHLVDPGAGGRVVSAGRDDLYPSRWFLHRRAGELRAPGGAGGRGGTADRLRRDGRGAVGSGHGGGGLRDTVARALQPGDHRRCGDPDLLCEPARVARSRSAVRDCHLRLRGDGRGDDCHRRRTPHRLGLTAIRSRPCRRSGSGSSGQRSGDGRDDPGVAAGVRQRWFVADRRRGHLQHRPGLPQTAEHQRAAGPDRHGLHSGLLAGRRRLSHLRDSCRALSRRVPVGAVPGRPRGFRPWGDRQHYVRPGPDIDRGHPLHRRQHQLQRLSRAGEFRCRGPLPAAPAHATRVPAGVLQRHPHAHGAVGGAAGLHRRIGQRVGAVLRDRGVHRLLDGGLRDEQVPPDRTRTRMAAQVGDQLLCGGSVDDRGGDFRGSQIHRRRVAGRRGLPDTGLRADPAQPGVSRRVGDPAGIPQGSPRVGEVRATSGVRPGQRARPGGARSAALREGIARRRAGRGAFHGRRRARQAAPKPLGRLRSRYQAPGGGLPGPAAQPGSASVGRQGAKRTSAHQRDGVAAASNVCAAAGTTAPRPDRGQDRPSRQPGPGCGRHHRPLRRAVPDPRSLPGHCRSNGSRESSRGSKCGSCTARTSPRTPTNTRNGRRQ